jgi:KUP system potassium uptake protein
MQAENLNFLPRMRIVHTSAAAFGQIYIPFVNWLLMSACILVVLGFRTSSNLAAAYGIAVTSTLAISSFFFAIVAHEQWLWGVPRVALVAGGLLLVDTAFLVANLVKIPQGGWFPLVAAVVIFTLMTTWKKGGRLVFAREEEFELSLNAFRERLRTTTITRVPGTAVFLSASPDGTPAALLANLKHNKVLHDRTVFLTIVTHDVPRVPDEDRIQLQRLAEGFYKIEAWYGFTEQPDIDEILDACRVRQGIAFDVMETSFFLSRENVIPTADTPGMAFWRDHLFAWMSRNAIRATDFFNIPANRVVELGTHIEI